MHQENQRTFTQRIGDEFKKSFNEGHRRSQTDQLLSGNSVIIGAIHKRTFKPVIIWRYVSETSAEEDKELKRLSISLEYGLYVCDLLPKFYVVSKLTRGKMGWYIVFPDETKCSMFYTTLEEDFPYDQVRDHIMATLFPELMVAEQLGLEERKKSGTKRVKRTKKEVKPKPKVKNTETGLGVAL
jgi:hypothetical protein